MKTAIIFHSANPNGNTRRLMEAANETLGAEVYMLDDYNVTPYDYEGRNLDDDYFPLWRELLGYDHLVFASPVYWYAVTGPMKIFFDRFVDLMEKGDDGDMGRRLRGKTASIIATGYSPEVNDSFLDMIVESVKYLGMSYESILYACCEDTFDERAASADIQKYIAHVRAISVSE